MRQRSDEYLSLAKQADESARVCTDDLARETFVEIAKQWRALAKLDARRSLWELP